MDNQQKLPVVVPFSGSRVNLEDLRKMANAILSKTGEYQQREVESDFFKLTEGNHLFHLCPPYNSKGSWSKYGATHYNIGGPHKGFFPCWAKSYPDLGFVCPICAAIEYLQQYTDIVKDMQATSYRYVNAVVYNGYDSNSKCFIPKRIKPFILRLPIKSVFSSLVEHMVMQADLGKDVTHELTGTIYNLLRPKNFSGKSGYVLTPMAEYPLFGTPAEPQTDKINQALSQLNDLDKIVCPIPTEEKLQSQLEVARSLLNQYLSLVGCPSGSGLELPFVVPPVVKEVHGTSTCVPATGPGTPPSVPSMPKPMPPIMNVPKMGMPVPGNIPQPGMPVPPVVPFPAKPGETYSKQPVPMNVPQMGIPVPAGAPPVGSPSVPPLGMNLPPIGMSLVPIPPKPPEGTIPFSPPKTPVTNGNEKKEEEEVEDRNGKGFLCPKCKKTFPSERGLRLHMSKSHKGE